MPGGLPKFPLQRRGHRLLVEMEKAWLGKERELESRSAQVQGPPASCCIRLPSRCQAFRSNVFLPGKHLQ